MIAQITRSFAVALVLVLTATAVWAAATEEAPATATEKETVFDPATGRTWTAPEYGGTLTWPANHHPPGIDPWHDATWAHHFIGGVNEGLAFADWALSRDIWKGEQGRILTPEMSRGSIAESWSMPDDKTFIWTIRQGVYWDDKAPMNGRQLDAYDVEWNYHRYLGLGDFADHGPSPHAGVFISQTGAYQQQVESVTATDQWTVEIKYTGPQLDLLQKMINNAWVALPREVIEEHGDYKDWRNVVGSGPWRLTDWVEGSSATWEKNPDYWDVDEKFGNRIPYIDELRSLLMPDIATRLAALRTGKVDLMSQLGDTYIQNIDDVATLQRTNPDMEFWSVYGRPTGVFYFNQSLPLFQDVKVRKALQMAVDRDTISASYFKGYADPAPYGLVGQYNAPGWFWPYDEWPDDLKEEYVYNPERAEQLLDEAGYPRGDDGYRFKVKLLLFDRFEPTHPELLMGYFDAIGIASELDVVTGAEAGALAKQDTHDYGLVASYYGYYAGSSFFPWLFNHVTQNPELNQHGSASKARDERMDALYVAARDTSDIDVLMSSFRQADEITVREHWGLVKSNAPMFFVSQPWIQGYFGEAQMGQSERNTHLARIWINQDMKEAMLGN